MVVLASLKAFAGLHVTADSFLMVVVFKGPRLQVLKMRVLISGLFWLGFSIMEDAETRQPCLCQRCGSNKPKLLAALILHEHCHTVPLVTTSTNRSRTVELTEALKTTVPL